ncbi:MAG: heparan-alpha-glucosaminide N-acetyltransferase domain-containing protein [Bacteroidota bacterium]
MPHSKQRYLFIDLLRFIAVLFMIQGHTFDATLDFSVRHSALFTAHDFFHGFIAPLFLFASGVAFGISTFKKWEDHKVLTRKVYKRIGRFVSLLIIGYALHLPFFSLQKIVTEATPAEIASLLQVDALHCIAITLLILQIAVLVLKTEKRFVLFTALLALVIVFAAPLVWSVSLREKVPLWFLSYLNAENNSWFPVFPWSGFLLVGVIFSWFFINAKEHHHAVVLMRNIAIAGIAAFIIPLLLIDVPFGVYPVHDVWKANPLIVFARLGFVAMATAGVFYAEHSLKIRSTTAQIMGRESLFIYILHLVILYGSVLNRGLQQTITAGLTVLQSSLVFLLIAGISALCAFGWYYFKKNYSGTSIAVQYSIAGILFILFITRPF